MNAHPDQPMLTAEALRAAADAAALAIPPAWPLASSVAVNPYLGQAALGLTDTGALLARVAGVPVTMPRDWYRDRIAAGVVTDADLIAAWQNSGVSRRPASIEALKSAIGQPAPDLVPVPTIADLAAAVSCIDWRGVLADRFGGWAGSFFDEGQALWAAPVGKGAYAAWRAVATHDLTPEIIGLRGFAAFVAAAPENATDAIMRATTRLGLSTAALQTYFHRLLITLGGWSQFARFRRWQAELAGGEDDTITDFLAIRLLWEEALFDQYQTQIGTGWTEAITAHAEPIASTDGQIVDAILQEASERRRAAHARADAR